MPLVIRLVLTQTPLVFIYLSHTALIQTLFQSRHSTFFVVSTISPKPSLPIHQIDLAGAVLKQTAV
jgi:hypothetical protein